MVTSEIQADGDLRVTGWTIPAKDHIPLHRHDRDYVVVPLVDDTMYVVDADGTESLVELRVGQSYSRPAGVHHTVGNPGTGTISFIEIERII